MLIQLFLCSYIFLVNHSLVDKLSPWFRFSWLFFFHLLSWLLWFRLLLYFRGISTTRISFSFLTNLVWNSGLECRHYVWSWDFILRTFLLVFSLAKRIKVHVDCCRSIVDNCRLAYANWRFLSFTMTVIHILITSVWIEALDLSGLAIRIFLREVSDYVLKLLFAMISYFFLALSLFCEFLWTSLTFLIFLLIVRLGSWHNSKSVFQFYLESLVIDRVEFLIWTSRMKVFCRTSVHHNFVDCPRTGLSYNLQSLRGI